jgi:hypothetical protein
MYYDKAQKRQVEEDLKDVAPTYDDNAIVQMNPDEMAEYAVASGTPNL